MSEEKEKVIKTDPFDYGMIGSSYEERQASGGASLADYNNNPGNIMYHTVYPDTRRGKGWTEENPVMVDHPKAGQIVMKNGKPVVSDYAKGLIKKGYDIKPGAANKHGVMIYFKDKKDGLNAKKDWWNVTKSWSTYKDLTVDDALLKYSGSGYDSSGIKGHGLDGSRALSSLNQNELDSLSTAQMQREDPAVFKSMLENDMLWETSGGGFTFTNPNDGKMDLASTIPGVGPKTNNNNTGPENLVNKNTFVKEKTKEIDPATVVVEENNTHKNINTEGEVEVEDGDGNFSTVGDFSAEQKLKGELIVNEELMNKDTKQGIDPNSVEGEQILSNLNKNENKSTLGGTPVLLEEGGPKNSTTSLIDSIDSKTTKNVKVKEKQDVDKDKNLDTKLNVGDAQEESDGLGIIDSDVITGGGSSTGSVENKTETTSKIELPVAVGDGTAVLNEGQIYNNNRVLSKEENDYIDLTRKNIDEISGGQNLDVEDGQILRAYEFNKSKALVANHDKKAANSAVTHLKQTFPDLDFDNKESFIAQGGTEQQWIKALPVDDKIEEERKYVNEKKEVLAELFSASKYSGSHANKVVALFGGHNSEDLDYGILTDKMEEASLIFTSQSELNRMGVKAALDLDLDQKEMILFKARSYVLNNYSKEVEVKAEKFQEKVVDFEANKLNFEDAESDYLQTESEINDAKEAVRLNTQFRRNPDGSESAVGYKNKEFHDEQMGIANSLIPIAKEQHAVYSSLYKDLESEEQELLKEQEDLKSEYETVQGILNINEVTGKLKENSFGLSTEFMAWENGMKHIPVIGHAYNLLATFGDATLSLKASLKASNLMLKIGSNPVGALVMSTFVAATDFLDDEIGGGDINHYGIQEFVGDYVLEAISPKRGFLPTDRTATIFKNLPSFKGGFKEGMGKFFSMDNLNADNPGDFAYHTLSTLASTIPYVRELAKAKINGKLVARNKRISKGDMRYKVNRGEGLNWSSRLSYKVKGSEHLARSVSQIKRNQKLLFFENMADGRARGLDAETAFIYGQATSFVTGLSQAIIPESRWFGTAAGKTGTKGFVSGLKLLKKNGKLTSVATGKLFNKSFKGLIPDMIAEFGEEALDMGLNDLVKGSMLTNYSPEIQNANSVGQMLVSTFVLTSALGGRKARRTYQALQQDVYGFYAKKSGKVIEEIDKQIESMDSALLGIDKRTKKGRELKEIINLEKEKLKETRAQALVITKAVLASPKNATVEQINALIKKQKLQKKLEGMDPATTGDIKEKINVLNEQIKNSSAAKMSQDVYDNGIKSLFSIFGNVKNGTIIELDENDYDKAFSNERGRLKIINDKIDERIQVIRDKVEGLKGNKENKKEINRLNKKIKQLSKEKQILKNSTDVGFYYKDSVSGNFYFVINKTKAYASGNTAVAQHEALHAILWSTVQTKEGRKLVRAMGSALYLHLRNDPMFKNSYLYGKFQKGIKDGVYINKETGELEWEEVLTIFSEALSQGSLTINDSFAANIKNIFRRMARRFGYNMEIKSAGDVINFLKDYNAEFQRGKLSKGFEKIQKNGITNYDKEFKRAGDRLGYSLEGRKQSAVDVDQNTIEKQKGKKSIDFDEMFDEENLNIIPEDGEQDYSENEGLVRDLALGYTDESWWNEDMSDKEMEDSGADKALAIIKALQVFDGLIAAKLKVSRNNADTQIFINDVYTELLSHIRNFNPQENNDLFGYINSQVSNKAGNVYNNEIKDKILLEANRSDQEGSKELADIIDENEENNEEDTGKKQHVAKKLGLDEQVDKIITRGFTLIKQGPILNKDGSIDIEKEEQRIKELDELGFVDGDGKIINLNRSYKDMPNILYKVIAKRFGVDASKLSPYVTKPFAGNLRRKGQGGSNELLDAQMELRKMGMEFFGAILPEGHTSTYEATGISKTKYKKHYNKGKRIGNNYVWYKNPIVDVNVLEEDFGIVDGKSFREDRLAQQNVISGLNILGQVMTIQTLVEVSKKTGDLNDQIRASIEDGKSKYAQSIFYIENPALQNKILKGLGEVGVLLELEDLDDYKTKDFRIRVKEIFKEVYKDSLIVEKDGKKINGAIKLADQLFGATGLLMQYGLMKDNYTVMGLPMPRKIDKFIVDNLLNKEKNNIELFDIFGLKGLDGENLTKNAAFTAEGIKKGRRNLKQKFKAIDKLVETGEIEEADAYRWILMMKGMYSSQGVLGDNTFMPAREGSITLVPSTKKRGKKSDGYITKQYSQVVTSTDDFNALLANSRTRFKIGKKHGGLTLGEIKTKYNIPPLYEESSKSVVNEIVNNKFDFNGRKDQALDARKLVTFMVKIATERFQDVDDVYDEMDVVQELFMMGSGMSSPTRRSAYVYGISEGAIVDGKFTGDIKNIGQDFEYDHLHPHHVLMVKIGKIVNGGDVENIEKDLENSFEDFVINIIPKTMDNVVKAMGMQYAMQEDYTPGLDLGNLKGAFGRLFSEKTLGDERVVAIEVLDPKSKVKVIGKEYVKNHNVTKEGAKAKKSIMYTEAIRKNNEMASKGQVKGISIWDFDDTLAQSNSNVLFVTPDGTKGKLTAEEFAKFGSELLDKGYVYDFSEFSLVVDGKPGPFWSKFVNRINKFGIKDNFILTARPENSAASIQLFLKELGVDMPIENITGLANSTSESKALWIVDKVGEGYNDIYFADDALQNVQAVKNVLEQFDVKSKVRQAKVKSSIEYSQRLNEMIQNRKGIDAQKVYSKVKAEKRGDGQGNYRFWIPPSAEDFAGMLYNFLGKGKQGDADMKFFKEVLLDPYAKGYNKINTAKQQAKNQYIELLKQSGLRKRLKTLLPGGDFIIEDAVRVYLWNKSGYDIPGISEADLKELLDFVDANPDIKAFADSVGVISRTSEGYVKPNEEWVMQNIHFDLDSKANEVRREEYLKEFIENRELVFGKWDSKGKLVGPNMNKIEAAYGKELRNSLEDIIWRMENGTNRSYGDNKMVNDFMNYVNGSIGATMFFNARSAVLQTLSTVNFINWEDNNIFNAASAFANQEQFWEDFVMIFQSDMLKQRRSGMTQDLNAAELMQHVNRSKNLGSKASAAIQFILQKGFLPTQMADSFAISMGGATFYRNRFNKYISEGMGQQEAKDKAFLDFQEIAEATQQSARPDLISSQQASVLGRLVLAFQNTPMQYNRIMKKAFLDLINGRGDAKAHVSRLLYYGFAQNLIFYSLQNALFALPFLDDEEEEDFLKGKKSRMLNSMLDSSLRGIGVYGAAFSTIKNMLLRFGKEKDKEGRSNYTYVILEFANFSPPVGIKLRKLYNATQTYKFNRDEIEDGQWMLSAEAISGVVEATTNLPLNRLTNKISNLQQSLNSDNAVWQRLAMVLGWNRWDVGLNRVQKTKSDIDYGGFEQDDIDYGDSDYGDIDYGSDEFGDIDYGN